MTAWNPKTKKLISSVEAKSRTMSIENYGSAIKGGVLQAITKDPQAEAIFCFACSLCGKLHNGTC